MKCFEFGIVLAYDDRTGSKTAYVSDRVGGSKPSVCTRFEGFCDSPKVVLECIGHDPHTEIVFRYNDPVSPIHSGSPAAPAA